MCYTNRKHNNANVLALGARISSLTEIKLIGMFLKQFEGGRHQAVLINFKL